MPNTRSGEARPSPPSRRRSAFSQFVADLADEFPAALGVLGTFYALGRAAVDYAQDTAALLGLGHDNLYGIRGSAEDVADLEAIADAAEQIDRVRLPDQ